MELSLLRGFVGDGELGGQGLYEIGLVPRVCRCGLFDEVLVYGGIRWVWGIL